MDKLTPTANQNRLSYLVELLLDKYNKGISNEALKLLLRKDAAVFGAKNMPTDIHSIGKLLGSTRIVEVMTRHRCGRDDCSYVWLGVVHPRNMILTIAIPIVIRRGTYVKVENLYLEELFLFWCS